MVGIGPKQPPSRKGKLHSTSISLVLELKLISLLPGSRHELPQNLLQHIKDFEDKFSVDRAKLKQIVAHFVKELEKGMSPCDRIQSHRINTALTAPKQQV
jgi:hexokinase